MSRHDEPQRRLIILVGVATLTGVLAMCVLGATGLCLAAAVLEPGSDDTGESQFSGLAVIAHAGLVLLILMAAHAGTSWWAVRVRPPRRAVIVTQAPYLAAYPILVIWWYFGHWPPWFIAWGAAALAALSWLTVWRWRAAPTGRMARVHSSAIAILVAVNGIPIAALAWQGTNGFGLRGQATPWIAVDALTSTSCLSGNPFHHNGSRVVKADCPSGPDADFYAGDYDEDAFDSLLLAEQPRTAFQRWWDWSRDYQLSFRLGFTGQSTIVDGSPVGPPYPATIDGENATVMVRVDFEIASHVGGPAPWRATVGSNLETWTVRLERVIFGGWKIRRIDVHDPIDVVFTAREPARSALNQRPADPPQPTRTR